MSTVLSSQNICNVVSTIADKKDQFVEFLVRCLPRQGMDELIPTLGYVLTSRDSQDVWEQGLALKGKHVSIVSADPSQQMRRGGFVPDYVWLVLYDRNAARLDRSPVQVRDREEDAWRQLHTACGAIVKRENVVPLICTANANFRRPYKPRRSVFHDGAGTAGSSSETGQMTETYLKAKRKLTDALLASIK